MGFSNLVGRQVEQRLLQWYTVDRQPPAKGWVNTIRQALGMSTSQLAERLGMTRQGVDDLEARERDSSTSLAALKKAADAMDCDFVYAIVPRTSVAESVRGQARRKAAAEMRRVAHTMILENQATTPGEVDRLIEERADQLLRTSRRALWSRADRSSAE
jgi:predicted DNA-binding mobile mystery protein A